VETPTPKRNPLLPILVGFLIAAFFDFRFYFVEHRSTALGLAVLVPIAIFLVLFFLRSRLAWVAALVIVFILAGVLLLTYHFSYMGFPYVFDTILLALLLLWVWRRREPYLRYVAERET
jgi:hypothetical protein